VRSEGRHLSISIDRQASEVYDFVSNPANLPEWAAGLLSSIEEVDGQWVADSSMGRIVVRFAERNEYGVLDHDVTLPSGESVYNPMRVIADGSGCEVVFTLRRQPGTSDADFERDADAVSADLAVLKRVLEREELH
jgi:Polyketide cyclase / dehydrase and lipid transport